MTLTFANNLTVGNCIRMSASMTGVPSTFNQYLTGFCRAGGNSMALEMPTGSTWNLTNNTFVTAQNIAWFVACSGTDSTCPATINSTNNVFLGYADPNAPTSGAIPTLYYFCDYTGSSCSVGPSTPPNITLNVSNNDEYGMRNGTCPSTTNNTICVSPLLRSQPSQTWVSEATLDAFNPFSGSNSFYPTNGSPLLAAGTTYSGIPSTDYYGVAYSSPPPIGAVEYVSVAPPTGLNALWWGTL